MNQDENILLATLIAPTLMAAYSHIPECDIAILADCVIRMNGLHALKDTPSVLSSFTWSDTIEGLDFWNNFESKYKVKPNNKMEIF